MTTANVGNDAHVLSHPGDPRGVFGPERPPARPPIEPDLRHPLSRYRPVLALTLFRGGSGHREVLVGVRTARANRWHQEVLSVPTLRVLPEVATFWASQVRHGPLGARELAAVPPVERTVERSVRELLALKLGFAESLELGDVYPQVHGLTAIQGTSLIDVADGRDVTEDLTMFNAQVTLEVAPGRQPSVLVDRWATASYDPLLWVPEQRFVELARTRDVGVLGVGLDDLFVCVRGLCIESTARVLAT